MSSGAYDNSFIKVNEFIASVEKHDAETAELLVELGPFYWMHKNRRQLFLQHLKLVSAAMQAVELEDSGDTGPELTDTAINMMLRAF